jgi:hypothetical protein
MHITTFATDYVTVIEFVYVGRPTIIAVINHAAFLSQFQKIIIRYFLAFGKMFFNFLETAT